MAKSRKAKCTNVLLSPEFVYDYLKTMPPWQSIIIEHTYRYNSSSLKISYNAQYDIQDVIKQLRKGMNRDGPRTPEYQLNDAI